MEGLVFHFRDDDDDDAAAVDDDSFEHSKHQLLQLSRIVSMRQGRNQV